jgi:hypothetical protein
MRLKAFLLTEGRSKPLRMEDATRLLRTKCSQAAKAYKKDTAQIYRGVEELQNKNITYIIDPKRFERVSRNTSNYYTIIMSNSKQWGKYPRRDQSIICANTREHAEHYGEFPFAVFPYNGSTIGVAPKYDIWVSFADKLGKGPLYLSDMHMFNEFIRRILWWAYGGQAPQDPLTMSDLKNVFKPIPEWWDLVGTPFEDWLLQDEPPDMDSQEIQDVEKLKHLKYGGGDFFSFLADILTPNKHGFKVIKTGQPLPKDRREIWTDGTCVLWQESYWDELEQALEPL